MNRGDRREPIFKDHADRARILEALGQCCIKTGNASALIGAASLDVDAAGGIRLTTVSLRLVNLGVLLKGRETVD